LKKINVVGTSGCGKTTFGKNLANVLSVEYIEMDALYWGKDWSWVDDEDFFSKITIALEKDAWVLDGNYNRTIPIKWENVNTVIWLDFSFCRTMFQAIKRAISRSITKKELWLGTGNKEGFKNSNPQIRKIGRAHV